MARRLYSILIKRRIRRGKLTRLVQSKWLNMRIDVMDSLVSLLYAEQMRRRSVLKAMKILSLQSWIGDSCSISECCHIHFNQYAAM